MIPAAATLSEEMAACRRAARDAELVLAKIGGVPLAPHEEDEAHEAKRRIAAALGVRL